MANNGVAERLSRLGVTVLERGWLSSNNILIEASNGPTTLIDSGYSSHAQQTLDLVGSALHGRPLDLLLNTHLHSDHCGGNAALQECYPSLRTYIPPGQAAAVASWDMAALSYTATGQECPRFSVDGLLAPGEKLLLGDRIWTVHGAKGHDPHAIVLYQQEERILISADALWQNGFGVVFPELEGESAFHEVAETLDLIESLSPEVVIPGHGPVFHDVAEAMVRARSRLAKFRESPSQHLRHAQKVLIKFRLLEWQQITRSALLDWVLQTPYLRQAIPPAADIAGTAWLDQLLMELERSNALTLDGETVFNR
ncbi:MBL fold metallo-hydrolase [Hydrogenophaga sp. RWCD_12]|uniref:MBL fold metallo-hydrolase n=1 Tax=Hydrogenophaga sp. RWCD_12 TaxID=3391190 RepID=UPI0039853ECD